MNIRRRKPVTEVRNGNKETYFSKKLINLTWNSLNSDVGSTVNDGMSAASPPSLPTSCLLALSHRLCSVFRALRLM